MTATLKLIPISREECRVRLERRGGAALNNHWQWQQPSSSRPDDEYDRARHPITLKLCASTEEVIEVDDNDNIETWRQRVCYAQRFKDGSVAATASLGRNHTTGIKMNAVSRMLAMVSLTRTSPDDKNTAAVVDLAASPTPNSVTAPPAPPGDDVGRKRDGRKSPPGHSSGADGETVAVGSLSMHKPAGKHAFCVNGILIDKPPGRGMFLETGSILSLYGPTGFAYEIVITQNGEEDDDTPIGRELKSTKKRRANPPTDDGKEKLRRSAHKQMIDECTCAMCMDILVRATFAYPCAHVFCDECSRHVTAASPGDAPATSTGTCPTCRGEVQGWMPARNIDTVVWTTALQGCFEKEDARCYLERRQKSGEPPPTEQEKECIFNSAEGENGRGGANKYLLPDVTLPPTTASDNLIKTLPPLFPAASNSASNLTNHSSLFTRKPSVQNSDQPAPNGVICID